ncbi:MAG: TonB-dependent receptor [Bacteroidetes bacterium]|nr:TonB-dependent receptor [Bacteroidota bacterium]
MKNILFAFIILSTSFTNSLFAKLPGIKGSIKNAQNTPVEFANVVLVMANDSAIVKAGLTETDGTYLFENIPLGQYKLLVVQLGYQKFYSEAFEVKESPQPVVLKEVVLEESAINLKEATITAKKPLIEHHIDKTVVNVENSVVNAGATAIEILKRSPGVIVDNEGNIGLSGKSGVNVMIDGKPTYLSAKDLYEMLKNMNSDQLSRIDIITNPSAKYDAAGNSGIIDIRLRKDKMLV